MNQTLLFDFSVDKKNKTIQVTREFAAQLDLVWDAWTKPELLDQWWAPKPYQTKTKTLNFREGGYWLYAMVGPEGDEQNCLVEFDTISDHQRYSGTDAFCDEKGNINNTLPSMHWLCKFIANGSRTSVHVEVTFKSEEDLQKIVEMGFQEGFAAAHNNLDEVLEKNAVAS